jgi:PEP-CTERM motif
LRIGNALVTPSSRVHKIKWTRKSRFRFTRKKPMILRIGTAGLVAVALIGLSNDDARAGSIHSPFTKAQAKDARIALYEHEMALRDANPTAFDHKHSLLGQVLSSEAGYDRFLAEHPFHHGLLCEHDPFLWRVVEGDNLYHKLHPFSEPPPATFIVPTVTIDSLPGGGTPTDGPPGGGGQNPGGPVQIASVPEPSSWMLMLSGAVLTLLAFARRRVFLKLSAARRVTA